MQGQPEFVNVYITNPEGIPRRGGPQTAQEILAGRPVAPPTAVPMPPVDVDAALEMLTTRFPECVAAASELCRGVSDASRTVVEFPEITELVAESGTLYTNLSSASTTAEEFPDLTELVEQTAKIASNLKAAVEYAERLRELQE